MSTPDFNNSFVERLLVLAEVYHDDRHHPIHALLRDLESGLNPWNLGLGGDDLDDGNFASLVRNPVPRKPRGQPGAANPLPNS